MYESLMTARFHMMQLCIVAVCHPQLLVLYLRVAPFLTCTMSSSTMARTYAFPITTTHSGALMKELMSGTRRRSNQQIPLDVLLQLGEDLLQYASTIKRPAVKLNTIAKITNRMNQLRSGDLQEQAHDISKLCVTQGNSIEELKVMHDEQSKLTQRLVQLNNKMGDQLREVKGQHEHLHEKADDHATASSSMAHTQKVTNDLVEEMGKSLELREDINIAKKQREKVQGGAEQALGQGSRRYIGRHDGRDD